MPRNLRGNVYLPMFDPNDMELERLQDILKTLFSDTWSKSLFIISNCTKADVQIGDMYGPPTPDMPGVPWLAIEDHPGDFYAQDQLCVMLKMPEMMTREELTSLVQQLGNIPAESDKHFSFFPKEV